MEAGEALERARAAYERRLAGLGAADWERPTPCPDWTVRQVASHVVGCALLYTRLLEGARGTEVVGPLRAADLLGDDPLGATRRAWEALAAAFGEPANLEGVAHHPAGEIPRAWLRVTAVEELTVHGWDLARAAGGDETVDDDVAAWILPPLQEMVGAFGAAFMPSASALPPDAGSGARLLHLTGRL